MRDGWRSELGESKSPCWGFGADDHWRQQPQSPRRPSPTCLFQSKGKRSRSAEDRRRQTQSPRRPGRTRLFRPKGERSCSAEDQRRQRQSSRRPGHTRLFEPKRSCDRMPEHLGEHVSLPSTVLILQRPREYVQSEPSKRAPSQSVGTSEQAVQPSEPVQRAS